MACKNTSVKKNGKREGVQRYLCTKCKKTFSSKRRPNRLLESIFKDYFYHRFTLTELSKKYGYSREWIQDKIHHFSPKVNTRKPRAVTVVIDATYFGKRRDKLGLIVAKDAVLKEPIAYNFIVAETKDAYRDLLTQIYERGFTLSAVVLDGKPSIISLFEGYTSANVSLPYEIHHYT